MNALKKTSCQSGFILTRHRREIAGNTCLEFWLATGSGPVKVLTSPEKDTFFICQRDEINAFERLNKENIRFQHKRISLKTFQFEPVTALYFNSGHSAFKAKTILSASNTISYENDIRLADRYLMERFVYGSASFEGVLQLGDTYPSYYQARLRSEIYQPTLKVLSLDIECSEDGELYSIGLATDRYQHVLMIGKPESGHQWITWVANEKELLQIFVRIINEVDPDIFVGWNVVNFDFRLLIKRAKIQRVPLNIGRDSAPLSWRDARGEVNQGYVSMAGRVVIDGIDALKTATYHFDSFSLEFVARELLGKGKKTENVDDRMAIINYDFKHNKVKLAEYNIQDCLLVLEIFEHTKLLDFLLLRSQLTGLALDRLGGSVAAFLNLYLPKLHRAGYVSPNRPKNGGLASPGGYVMDSLPGLYQHVLVLDFKSLYPSIIRTFKVDPLGLIEGLLEPDSAIKGYKEAFFSRDKHFLPDIIEMLWLQRDEAKRNNDTARSQAIKILMNSFYGVLGSGGCPFYDTRLASSITMRGHNIMQVTAKWIEEKGYKVIYGDTDSIFVWLNGEYENHEAVSIGQDIQKQINRQWTEKIRHDHQLENHLEIEFETHFTQFFMPTIRGSDLGSKKRYAGVKLNDDKEELVFKGLETVRSDWTALAKKFQYTLYKMVFSGDDVRDYLRSIISDTRKGEYDELLVYRKRLRRRLNHYVKNVPPHVKAARFADAINEKRGKAARYQHKGWIEYLITLNGPEAVEYRSSCIDYDHYIEKQIRPIAEGILPFVNLSFDEIAGDQLGLFH